VLNEPAETGRIWQKKAVARELQQDRDK